MQVQNPWHLGTGSLAGKQGTESSHSSTRKPKNADKLWFNRSFHKAQWWNQRSRYQWEGSEKAVLDDKNVAWCWSLGFGVTQPRCKSLLLRISGKLFTLSKSHFLHLQNMTAMGQVHSHIYNFEFSKPRNSKAKGFSFGPWSLDSKIWPDLNSFSSKNVNYLYLCSSRETAYTFGYRKITIFEYQVLPTETAMPYLIYVPHCCSKIWKNNTTPNSETHLAPKSFWMWECRPLQFHRVVKKIEKILVNSWARCWTYGHMQ